MINPRTPLLVVLLAITALAVWSWATARTATVPEGREEVVFWHFWGGRDRPIVERIVEQFNASQDRYWVRAIARPGSNLDLKFFLSVAGGDPPDLLSHDDPVVADWAHRGVLTPLKELADDAELSRLEDWLFPAARQLATYDGQLYALASGLDIRALYCNKTLLAEHGLSEPRSLEDLDRIAEAIAPSDAPPGRKRMGYLPDPRRIWAWGIVFGGDFADHDAAEPAARITADSPELVAALDWMAGYSRRYGPSEVAAFRSGEQALTGAAFPLLADRRYAVLMDGQWRVRDIAEASGDSSDEIIVVPLPAPAGGREQAGWVNGNFFVVPRQAKQKQGAWQFMKFWSGFDGHESQAAEACAAGGWIPASRRVVEQPAYQQALNRWPLLHQFVELAASGNQRPVPAVAVASLYYQEVIGAAQEVMYRGDDPQAALTRAAERTRQRLREVLDEE
jgi:multiple sugar transport system substrate-binding protein